MENDPQTERAAVATEAEQEPDPVVPTPGTAPAPWIVVGLVILVVFLAILVLGVLQPLA